MPRPIDTPFGEHLRKWRNDRALSSDKLAQLLGVHPRAIARLEELTIETAETQEIEQKCRELQQKMHEPTLLSVSAARSIWELERMKLTRV
jgi:predicted transcriptional regulator